MAERLVGVALVGLGWWSSAVSRAAKKSQRLRIVNCYTRTPEKRKKFAESFGCRESKTYEEVLQDPDVEGVLLTTPNSGHQEQILKALSAGKHVFVEKPITNTLPEAREVIAAHRKTRLTLMVGQCYRRAAGHRRAKRLIEEGRLGKLILAESNFSVGVGPSLTPDKWRYHEAECPGGPLTQIGIHHADTLAYLFGPIRRVTGAFSKLNTPAEVSDLHVSMVEFESGALGYMGCSFATPLVYSLNVYGSEGNLYMTTNRSDVTQTDRLDLQTELSLQEKDNPGRKPLSLQAGDMVLEELEEFSECIRTGKSPETGVPEGVKALAFVHAAIRSFREERPVSIAEMLEGVGL